MHLCALNSFFTGCCLSMEFHEKLQELRKKKGLTQEELAQILYVSRTAVSKWESGRGYPSIDSLKALAKFFSVTVDDLLSGDQVLTLAEAEHKQKEQHVRSLVFGLLDCCAALFFFLPFFGQTVNGTIYEVSLFSLTEIAPYLKAAYAVIVITTIAYGLLTLVLQNCTGALWVQNKSKISLALTGIGALLFTVSLQPYAAAFLFVFFVIKVLLLMKWQ